MHSHIFLLTGAAGSGKSTLVRHVFFGADFDANVWKLKKHVYTNPKTGKETFTLYHQRGNCIILGAYKYPEAPMWHFNKGKVPINGGTDRLQPQSTLATRDLILTARHKMFVIESSTGKILNKMKSLLMPIVTSPTHSLIVVEMKGLTRLKLVQRVQQRDRLTTLDALNLVNKTERYVCQCKRKFDAHLSRGLPVAFIWAPMSACVAKKFLMKQRNKRLLE